MQKYDTPLADECLLCGNSQRGGIQSLALQITWVWFVACSSLQTCFPCGSNEEGKVENNPWIRGWVVDSSSLLPAARCISLSRPFTCSGPQFSHWLNVIITIWFLGDFLGVLIYLFSKRMQWHKWRHLKSRALYKRKRLLNVNSVTLFQCSH